MGRPIIIMGTAIILSVVISFSIPSVLKAQEIIKTGPTPHERDIISEKFNDQPVNVQGKKELNNVLGRFDEKSETTEEVKDLNGILQGFEEKKRAGEEVSEKEAPKKPPFWELRGSLSLGGSYGFAHNPPQPGQADYRELSRLSPDLHLNLDLKLSERWKALISGRAFYDFAYEIKGREQFTDEVLNEYEKEAEFREVYLQGSLHQNLDLKVGRQIVVWGRGDNIRVVDILNPLDLREPGLADIEDLRLPVTMTRLDCYFGQWNVSGIAVHEIRFNKTPVFGSEFYPSDFPLTPEKKPSNTLENTQYGLSLNGIFSGWDISFYASRFFDDQSHVTMVYPLQLERHHSRLTMVGMAISMASGNWLLKSEAAYFDGLEFFALPGEKKSRFDVMGGIEYTGFTDTMISLETVNRHITDFDRRLESPPDDAQEDEFQVALRYSGNFMHDTLHLVLLASRVTVDDGAFQRISVEYDVTDAFSVKVGLVTYQSGDEGQFRNIGDNDRFFFEAKYWF